MKYKGTSYMDPVLYIGPSEGLEMNSSYQSMYLADVTCNSITGILCVYFGVPEEK